MKNILLAFAAMAGLSTAHGQVLVDGIFGNGAGYQNSKVVTWYNGHGTSVYGDFDNQFAEVTIHHGVSSLAGGTPGQNYFFLYIEAPLQAKNMIWSSAKTLSTNPALGLTAADLAPYGLTSFDFSKATGSEKLLLLDNNGNDVFMADYAADADNKFGLINFKDSSDYLLDNGLATLSLSLNRNQTMSFEFQFALNATENAKVLNYLNNGIEFHLSPERGLPVPEPGAAAMVSLVGALMLLRRRR